MFSVLPGKFHSLRNTGPGASVRIGTTPDGGAAGVTSLAASRSSRQCQARRRGRIAADSLGDRSEGRTPLAPGRATASGIGIFVRACRLIRLQGLDGRSADDRRYAIILRPDYRSAVSDWTLPKKPGVILSEAVASS